MKNIIITGWSCVSRWVIRVLLASALCIQTSALYATTGSAEVIQNLAHARIFEQPLRPVGSTPPSIEESQELWDTLGVGKFKSLDEAISGLKTYAGVHTNSAWTPSLNANLGMYYRNHGYFSDALDCWQKAWTASKDSSDLNARQVADYVLANWLQLLASLGRIETMDQLFKETQNRQILTPFQTLYNQDRDGYFGMLSEPGKSYRCGSFALNAVAKSLYGSNDYPQIVNEPSPATGFSMSALVSLAASNHLDIVAVDRPQGDETLVAPSVVHWKENHYAAIISQHGENFEVIDPTFRIHKWLTRNAINAEASGQFLVAEKQIPPSWKSLSPQAADKIFGKGAPSYFNPAPPPCMPCPCPPGSNGSGGNSSGKNGSGSSCSSCGAVVQLDRVAGGGSGSVGMPDWSVNEPNIDLRLHDLPLTYRSSIADVSFKIDYWQRDDRVADANASTMGPSWECAWVGYIDLVGGPTDPVYVHPPGGGELFFFYIDGTTPNYYYNLRIQLVTDGMGNRTGYELLYPDGAVDEYGFMQTDIFGGASRAYLTQKTDRNGRAVRFIYTPYNPTNGVVRLDYVVDVDGKTNTLSYTNNAVYNYLISQVKDPYNRTASFTYDTNGYLSSVTDEIGMTSSFRYGNVAVGVPGNYVTNCWLNALITPYGTNSFAYFDNNLQVADAVNRAVVVTKPDASREMFIHRGYNSLLPYSFNDEPTNLPSGISFDTGDGFPLDNENMWARNSYYWDARQFANLSSAFQNSGITNWDFSLVTTNDYQLGRMRHWAHTGDFSGQGDGLSMERNPSPDGIGEGQKTWYAYTGVASQFNALGSSANPALTIRVQPDGYDWYRFFRFDQFGNVTNEVETYSSGYGQAPLTRTNVYVYKTNGVDLVAHIGPTGNVDDGYDWKINQLHLLSHYTNAVKDVTTYTYDSASRLTSTKIPAGLTTTNIFYSSGSFSNFLQTSITLEIGGTNSFTYTNGLVYTHTDERGATETNVWDNLGRLLTVSDARGTLSYTYTNLDLVRVVDRMGFTTSYGYDRLRHMTNQVDALTNATLYTYCSCGSLDSIRDATGTNYTYFNYDNAGRRVSTVYPDGYAVTNNYSLLGQVTNTVDTSGMRITNWFNNQGLKYASSNGVGLVEFLSFNIKDYVTNQIDANGVAVGLTCDELGRVLKRRYPDGGGEQFIYSLGELTIYTNQLNNYWTYAYDAAMRKTNEIAIGVYTNSFAYNAAGDLLTLLDGKNQKTTWNYDQFGRVTNKVDNLGTNLFVYRYDADNRLTNRVSAAKGPTLYSYDAVGNLTLVDYSNSPDVTLQYDMMNHLTKMVDAVGTTTYAYDSAGQLRSEDGPWDADTVSYTYANRLRTGLSVIAPNASPWTQKYTYDAARRLTNVTSSAGSFTYLLGGSSPSSPLVRKLSLPNGAYITNSYDSVARMTGTYLRNSSDVNLDTEDYVYNVGGQRTQQVFTAGNYMSYTYDNVGQLKTEVGKEPTGTTNRMQEQFGYFYDAAGNLNYRTNNSLLSQFNVNNLNELTTSTNGGKLTVAGSTTSQATSVTVNGAAAILYLDASFATNQSWVNGNNTYTAIAQDSYGRKDTNVVIVNLQAMNTYAYDLNGNMVTNGTRVFEYDDENQLLRITEPSTWKSEFAYDGKMRRRIRREFTWDGSMWLQTNEVRYVYEGKLVIQERDANNLPQVTYTRGTDSSGTLQNAGGISGLLARTDMRKWIAGSVLAHALYHANASGNITSLIFTNQSIAAKYEYDAFGNRLACSGPLADVNLYQYSSKEFHNASGLIYFLYRYYDPTLQKWTARDPLGEPGFEFARHIANGAGRIRLSIGAELIAGQNLYSYVNNISTGLTDPFGLLSYGNPVSDGNGPVGPSSPYSPGFPYYPDGYLYQHGPPQVDPKCFSDCMNQWIGDPCKFALGVAGGGALYVGLTVPVRFAGLPMPFYEALAFWGGTTFTSSSLVIGVTAAGGAIAGTGGVLAAGGAGYAGGITTYCLAHCAIIPPATSAEN